MMEHDERRYRPLPAASHEELERRHNRHEHLRHDVHTDIQHGREWDSEHGEDVLDDTLEPWADYDLEVMPRGV